MDPRYGLTRQGSGLWRSLRDGDFEEEDVWNVLRERSDSSSKYENFTESSLSGPRKVSTAARMIPRMSSSSSNSSLEPKVIQQSAPVNIPDWSKIYGNKSKNNASKNTNPWFDHDQDSYDDDDDDDDDDVDGDGDDGDELYDDSEYNDKLPPHELIARRLARSQISTFSVFEGVGRTLKGRDLSKVRNAVLIKTGFLESL